MNIFHYKIIKPVIFACIINLYNMWICNCCSRSCFSAESSNKLLAMHPLSKLSVHDFNCYRSIKAFIFCLINSSHATLSYFAHNAIAIFNAHTWLRLRSFIHCHNPYTRKTIFTTYECTSKIVKKANFERYLLDIIVHYAMLQV